jgi:hypothetical protein
MDGGDLDRQRRLAAARRTAYLSQKDPPLMASPGEIGAVIVDDLVLGSSGLAAGGVRFLQGAQGRLA